MNKRFSFIFAAVVLLNIIFTNASFAIQEQILSNNYPDYGYEFNGKDTCERFNRRLFIFNLKLNKYVLRPINIVWASILPKYGMDRLKNVYNNINYPVRVVSCLLQKDFPASKQETKRFFINTTMGVVGMYDPAKTKFKLEPRSEDMGQALAHCKKIKSGPYLILPVVHGSVRDLAGKLLDCPFNPCSYVLGPFSILANAAFFINNSTYAQPLIKKVEQSYADPYMLARQIDGFQDYIKFSNLDRRDFLKEQTVLKDAEKIKNVSDNSDNQPDLVPDVNLADYNPQGAVVDSMRTVLFEGVQSNDSIWCETSLWNKTFDERLKTASVNIDKSRPNYKYRYILQKSKTSPVAIIYPSIGEGIHSDHSATLAKMLYEKGYSVIIQGSSFQWEFIKSMPKGFKPGMPAQDAQYVRLITAKILDTMEKKNYNFSKKIIVGCSFGALTALFVDSQEENDDTLGVSNYIAINPPINMFFALNRLDKYCKEWQNDSTDIKMKAAVTAEKVVQIAQKVYDKDPKTKCECFPFTDDEGKLIVSFVMRQKLSDVVFAIENGSRCKKNPCYECVNKMSFHDYGQKYLFVNAEKSPDQYDYETSMYSISDFLQRDQKYKIYHTLDDYFVNHQQLAWLKQQTGDRSVFLSNGSHLGFLYRKEFLDSFQKDIAYK